jgi:outer membrane protein assembly factor BamB
VAGCGNIPTLGVTSTPVADPTSGVVFVVAETATGTPPAVSFHLFGLDAANGAVTFERDVTPPLPQGENPVHLLQRAALALGNGRVYVAYGGQYGDCGLYHGWVVSAPVSGTGPDEAFDVTPAASGGAIWDGGSGPVVEPDGTVLVTTGNPNGGGGPAPWAEAVLALPPGLGASPDAVFVDPAATGDLDLATGGAVPVPGNLILAVGKTDIGYLLDPVGLSLVARVGGQVCGSDPDGGAAVDAADDTVYVPCRDGGIQEIDLRSRHTGWRSGPANSTVVLAGGRLWSVSYPRGELTALDPATGTVEQTVEAGPVPTFASVSVWGGRVLVPTDSGLSSFG